MVGPVSPELKNPEERVEPGPDASLILKSLPHPVLVIKDDGIASYVNDAAEVFLASVLRF